MGLTLFPPHSHGTAGGCWSHKLLVLKITSFDRLQLEIYNKPASNCVVKVSSLMIHHEEYISASGSSQTEQTGVHKNTMFLETVQRRILLKEHNRGKRVYR